MGGGRRDPFRDPRVHDLSASSLIRDAQDIHFEQRTLHGEFLVTRTIQWRQSLAPYHLSPSLLVPHQNDPIQHISLLNGPTAAHDAETTPGQFQFLFSEGLNINGPTYRLANRRSGLFEMPGYRLADSVQSYVMVFQAQVLTHSSGPTGVMGLQAQAQSPPIDGQQGSAVVSIGGYVGGSSLWVIGRWTLLNPQAGFNMNIPTDGSRGNVNLQVQNVFGYDLIPSVVQAQLAVGGTLTLNPVGPTLYADVNYFGMVDVSITLGDIDMPSDRHRH